MERSNPHDDLDAPIPYAIAEPPPVADGRDLRFTRAGLVFVSVVFAALVLGAVRGWW